MVILTQTSLGLTLLSAQALRLYSPLAIIRLLKPSWFPRWKQMIPPSDASRSAPHETRPTQTCDSHCPSTLNHPTKLIAEIEQLSNVLPGDTVPRTPSIPFRSATQPSIVCRLKVVNYRFSFDLLLELPEGISLPYAVSFPPRQ